MTEEIDRATEEYGHRNSRIPMDLFVSKKHEDLSGAGNLRFSDAAGDIVFKVEIRSSSSNSLATNIHTTLLLDAHGNSLLSLHNPHNGSWQLFKEDNNKEDPVFRVERRLNTHSKTEFEIFLAGENRGDSESVYTMKGSPFQRSCTIYKGDSVVAQTSLMYKLHGILVTRRRFRLTIFPGQDHPFIVALIVIFFHGRKLWI